MSIGPNVGWKLHFDPINEAPETIKLIEEELSNSNTLFKRLNGGEPGGKYFTAYPQSLEKRDELISILEKPHIKKFLKAHDAVEANYNITDTISGRFTTGYTQHDSLGQPIFDKSTTAPNEGLAGKTAADNGKINRFIKDSWGLTDEAENTGILSISNSRLKHSQQVEDALRLRAEHPQVFDLMMGKSGYVSPYEKAYPDNVKNFIEEVRNFVDPKPSVASFPVDSPKSFKTSQGSVYTYGADGRVTRQKSVSGSTMEASSSSFDKTVFLPEEDLSSAKAGLGRGLKPTESGQFRGLDYDPSKMDKQKFMDLRFKQKKAFDEAYTSAGGTISERLITPETQPKIGLHPLEYNLGDNKFHAGNEVTEIVAQDGTITRIDRKPSVAPEAAPTPTTARIDSTPPPSGSTMKPVGTPSDVSTEAKVPFVRRHKNNYTSRLVYSDTGTKSNC